MKTTDDENCRLLQKEPESYKTTPPCLQLIALLLLVSLGALITIIHVQGIIEGTTPPNSVEISEGKRIYLKASTSSGLLYVRVNVTSADLILTDDYPRIHSSAFEVYPVPHKCFQLKSVTGKWLRLDSDSGNLYADATSQSFASSFLALRSNTTRSKATVVNIRACNVNQWLSISLENRIHKVQSDLLPGWTYYQSLLSFSRQDIIANGSSFEMVPQQQFQGVNFGGMFIPEFWMTPHFFNHTGSSWGASLCSIANLSQTLAEDHMMEYINNWITEDDFRQIVDLGFNSIRLPVGYWNIIPDPFKRYAPSDYRISLSKVDWCFDMAEKYGLSILLDLHGGTLMSFQLPC